MKAIILCAGLGTRLRPLTNSCPKPALPFLGAPLLRASLALVKQAGIREVGINVHAHPEVMARVAAAECAKLGLKLELSREAEIQGTGGGIRGLRHFVGDEPFVVLNGDILFAVALGPIIEAHLASKAAATMVLLPMPEGARYAAVEMDAQASVRRIAGFGPGGVALSPWHFTGVHVMGKEVFDFMAPSGAEDINHHVYPKMISAGRVIRGHVVDGYWSDLGTPERYLKTVRDVLFGQVPSAPFGESWPLTNASHAANVWRRDAEGSPRAAGPAFLDRCRVADSVWLGAGVYVGEDAHVGEGARINRSAVLEGTEIAPGEALEDVIAWGKLRVSA